MILKSSRRMPKDAQDLLQSAKNCKDFKTHDDPLNLLAAQILPNSGLKGP